MLNTDRYSYFISFTYNKLNSLNSNTFEVALSDGYGNTSVWRSSRISDLVHLRHIEAAIEKSANITGVIVTTYKLLTFPSKD